jgi:hypothetical protein
MASRCETISVAQHMRRAAPILAKSLSDRLTDAALPTQSKDHGERPTWIAYLTWKSDVDRNGCQRPVAGRAGLLCRSQWEVGANT